ncbi:MFS transporter [Candidatus Uabimicrobium sp. HlEnr_7]|uniref:MFS transporter n=1 Tax=Candidatus Uabimicrobium helgolandensis TaxID=3095367 RepID=UPI003558A876
MLNKIFKSYQLVKKDILNVICAQFCLNLINTSFILIFNIYLAKRGLSDAVIADITSYRFLGVLCCAFPLGFYIKGKALRPFFFYAAYGMPVIAFFTLYAAKYQYILMLQTTSFLMGICFSCIQIVALPFIVRNTEPSQQPEAISLLHATFSFSMVICSLLIFVFGNIPNVNEQNILVAFTTMGFLSIYFISRIDQNEYIPEVKANGNTHTDWAVVFKALFPRIVIAIGAGLTIPYMNLFFYSVHGLDYDSFSLLNFFTASFVAVAVVYVPEVRRKYGLHTSIISTQSAAVMALTALALTDVLNIPFAMYVAFFCFVVRQPLMNMAGPMTAHLTMEYVGEKNQEITSALAAATWSGSWFLSGKMFKYLRTYELSYGYIFLITAALYIVGVISYHILILHFEKRTLSLSPAVAT